MMNNKLNKNDLAKIEKIAKTNTTFINEKAVLVKGKDDDFRNDKLGTLITPN